MKIVQSFWSKPVVQPDTYIFDSRLDGGWPHRSLNYYSWVLSCLQLRKYYNSVELVTDKLGKELLIDRLKLPYTKVTVALNDIDNWDVGYWALGKIYTYGLQKEPFLHVDGDVFIAAPFEKRITRAILAAQNLEKGYPPFFGKYKAIWQSFTNPPSYFSEIYKQEYTDCCNAGILGGTDASFFRNFAGEVFSFLEKNKEGIGRTAFAIDASCINVIIEQAFFYWYARHCNKPVTYLFPQQTGTSQIGFFQSAGKNKQYVHCLGFFKNFRASYSYLEWKIRTDYPEYYRRVARLLNTCEI